MKVHPRYFPILVLAAFAAFFLLGLALGFLPQHSGGGEGRGRHGASLPVVLACAAPWEAPE